MKKFVCTHSIPGLDSTRVEAIRRAIDRAPEIIVTKAWFSLGEGKMVSEVEASAEAAVREAFDQLDLPVVSMIEAEALLQRARLVPVMHA